MKAENCWSIQPSISAVYESGTLAPVGKAAFGETAYIYSSDKINLISFPRTAGTYYFKALSDGDENHNPISSEWIEVEIIAVIPVGISVDMVKTSFLTLENVSNTN